ncbi:hypothetical protein SAMN06265365_1163 [Tistlia consotensis]|uniref:Gluconate 2-dehydrogenase subunit 3 n=1 Tax=Tistlia consotensis USBA 355 TaxID=560819 RepID=A0A1Y6CDA4_9PROT|nr:hypothetical protein [Tistlia consotensis]SMF49057.1 hypothetical protein SAMN05428998_117134 [Tistlia consotensis USBA 355]SNR80473.1 hypothetical protein SAMN06265365_1163 [Tistlia consotensis]
MVVTRTVGAYKDPALPAPLEVPEGEAWLSRLTALEPGCALTLEAAARTLCPHDAVPDRCYRRVVLQLDRGAAANPDLAGLLAQGAAQLDGLQPLAFAELSEGGRVAALRQVEGGPFFRAIQRGTVRHLYDDREVWALFGYEGSAHQLGGYRERGFADLAWLADPPKAICEGEGDLT